MTKPGVLSVVKKAWRRTRRMSSLLRPPTLIEIVKPYTLLDEERLASLSQLAATVIRSGIPGDFVECGVCRGGSAALLAKFLDGNRKLWLYDSFQGLPPPTESDGTEAGQWQGACRGTRDDVSQIMAKLGASSERLVIREGWFAETFHSPLPGQIALLHCDADWYDSVMLVLETFYSKVNEGGCVILDDFGHWEGCREAFYEFCQRRQERPLLERCGYTQAFWFKGKKHNRA